MQPSKISQAGLDLIALFEGLRLQLYYCPAGKPTIGVGHVVLPGEGIPNEITKSQAMELLAKDVERFERAVSKAVAVEINQNQFDALVSFSFNVGEGGLQGTSIIRAVNERRFADVPQALNKWVRANVGGKLEILPGLVRRRKAEGDLFMLPGGHVMWTKPALIDAQATLKQLGLYKIAIDGLWGPGTARAVKAFAESKGIALGDEPNLHVPKVLLDELAKAAV